MLIHYKMDPDLILQFPSQTARNGRFPDLDHTDQTLHRYRINFREYLDIISNSIVRGNEDLDNEFYHWGLDSLFGVELEFLSNNSRYDMANRANNCIYNQNSLTYRRNYDVLSPNPANRINHQQRAPANQKSITTNHTDFDQWSSFMIEALAGHGASTHRGIPTLNPQRTSARGSSGNKIENDGSVNLNGRTTVSVWGHSQNGIATQPIYIGLNSPRINVATFENDANIFSYNEFVSGVLVNEPYQVNHIVVDDEEETGYLPYGWLNLDNAISHLTNHGNEIYVGSCGLHIHVSRNPRTDYGLRGISDEVVAVGLAKLYYIFEPFFCATHPSYRSGSNWACPFQSKYNLIEIMTMDTRTLYNQLTRNSHSPRRLRDDIRYCALNFYNLRGGGIGTIELRIGHSTFDSEAVQLYIHLYQVLYHFNLYLLSNCDRNAPFAEHLGIITGAIRQGAVPIYCGQTAASYDITPNRGALGNANPGHPRYGFFESSNDERLQTSIITKLAQLFFSITGAEQGVMKALGFINLYHCNQINPSPTRPVNICTNPTLINTELLYIYPHNITTVHANNYRRQYIEAAADTYRPIPFNPVRMFVNYRPKHNQTNLLHHCLNCAVNANNQCDTRFATPAMVARVRSPGDQTNKTHMFIDDANRGEHQKVQTELLNNKLSNGTFSGGRLKNKTKKLILKRGGPKLTQKGTMKKSKSSNRGSSTSSGYDKPSKKNDKNEDNFRINQETCSYNLEIKGGTQAKLYYTAPFTYEEIEEEQLSKVCTNLLSEKVLSKEQIELLVKYNYIEFHIWKNNTDVIFKEFQQNSHLSTLQMSDIKNIQNIYEKNKA